MNVFEKEFDFILEKAKKLSKPMRVVVAGADAEHLLQAVFEAEAQGFAFPVLVGNEERIHKMIQELKLELVFLFWELPFIIKFIIIIPL